MNLGNTELVNYGIHTDESDYHIHVAFQGQRLYVFPTKAGRKALTRPHNYYKFEVSQPGAAFITGVGYKVPWRDIDGCIEICIPQDILDAVDFDKNDSTTEKGRKAVQVTKEMFRRGLIVLPALISEIDDKGLQMKGHDIIIVSNVSYQIKCDYWAARYGIALQTAECNPFNRF